MVLLEQYVTLYETRWKSVFAGWKILQITIYLITAVTGILSSFCMGKLVISFDGYCLLYSNVTLLSGNKIDRVTDVDLSISDWGKPSYCEYCQYVPVCSVIFASMWLTFFIMCGRGGRSDHGLPQPWRIVYPAMLFNVTYFLIAVVALVWYEGGYHQFCHSLVMNNDISDCDDLQRYKLKDLSGKDAILYLLLTRIGLWGITFGWLLGAALLVLRCCFMADFTVMKITVIGATPMEEEAPKASPESVHLSPEEKHVSASLNVPAIL